MSMNKDDRSLPGKRPENREQQLIEELVRVSAEKEQLDRKYRRVQEEKQAVAREHKQAVSTVGWKTRSSLRKALKKVHRFLFGSTIHELKRKNLQLQNDKTRLNRQLKNKEDEVGRLASAKDALEADITRLRMEIEEISEDELQALVTKSLETGEILSALDQLVSTKGAHETKYLAALRKAAGHYLHQQGLPRNAVYNRVLTGMKMDEVPEFMIRSAEKDTGVELNRLASFRGSLTSRSILRQTDHGMPEWLLDRKKAAYRLADLSGVKRPWVSDRVYSVDTLPEEDRVVVKPADGAGGRGVYLVFSSDRIEDVKRSQTLNSRTDLLTSMREDLAAGRVEKDEWVLEELVADADGEPARDLKFYCFYGKAALVLEVIRYPETKYCWWSPDGEKLHTGKYGDRLFNGNGFTQEEREAAERLSLDMPVPFMRIDFLKTERVFMFGEFTPKPGNYDAFDEQTDRILGEFFMNAEQRLLRDLLNQKMFQSYERTRSEEGRYN
ncbi:ATP-grasp fold amidoligase family protein [Alteribacter natronophilus]|uniref:ATP-grasp fold amidoligase family protein n=1 Tax=Alteribacter natronophilus TaxID=2583810 RepID=UPI00110F4F09|nr:ATP-grasp fold amidoligase family protein [Alteribacter natronophilus]TMW72350.1 teichuronopeptide biosynthesis [Alteribacter natronophilus]